MEQETPREPQVPFPGRAFGGIFEVMAKQPLLVLAVLAALQAVFLLDARALWFSDEIRYANVFEHLVHAKKWIVLYLNGEAYPDKPPVYFWFLAAIWAGLKEIGPRLFMLGAAGSGFLYLASTLALGRTMGADKRVRLASGLILLSTFYFVGVNHYSRMDLLFGALITLSHCCLFRAWTAYPEGRGGRWTSLGFFLMAMATLTKGPLGFAFPFLASVFFLLWTGKIRRLFRQDVLAGLLIAVAILGLWVAGAYLYEGEAFMQNIFHDQIYKRATDTWHHGHPFYHYFATLPAAWLPWTLLLFAAPVLRVLTPELWSRIWRARNGNPGRTYLWIAFLSGFALLSAISIKIIIYLIPLFAPLAVICADGLLQLDARRTARLRGLLTGLLVLLAAALPLAQLAYHYPPEAIAAKVPWRTVLVDGVASSPVPLEGLFLCAGVFALAALLFGRGLRGAGPSALVLALALTVTALIQPLGLVAAPSIDAAMSPKAQGETMRHYIGEGYQPMAYKVYPGTYTFYAGQNVTEVKDYADVDRMLSRYGKIVIGMRKKYWDQWENRPLGFHVVHVQWIVDRPFVLAVRDGDPVPLNSAPGAPEAEMGAQPDAAQPGVAEEPYDGPEPAPEAFMPVPDGEAAQGTAPAEEAATSEETTAPDETVPAEETQPAQDAAGQSGGSW